MVSPSLGYNGSLSRVSLLRLEFLMICRDLDGCGGGDHVVDFVHLCMCFVHAFFFCQKIPPFTICIICKFLFFLSCCMHVILF